MSDQSQAGTTLQAAGHMTELANRHTATLQGRISSHLQMHLISCLTLHKYV